MFSQKENTIFNVYIYAAAIKHVKMAIPSPSSKKEECFSQGGGCVRDCVSSRPLYTKSGR